MPRTDSRQWRYLTLKRAFDVAFSSIVLVAGAAPMALLCAVIVYESGGGSPIYVHRRVGLNGKPIGVLKLRTMVKDSDNVEKYFTSEQLETWKREYKVDNDPRVTRIGAFLRKTSLDELPQFLNVLKGDLSVIGPRPIVIPELEQYGSQASEFLSCRPGITGWWQATERNEATYDNGRRQELELFYVRNASLRLDAIVFFKTFGAIFGGTGK